MKVTCDFKTDCTVSSDLLRLLLFCFSQGLTVQDLDSLSPDVFLMSPPCQPFTRYTVHLILPVIVGQGSLFDPRVNIVKSSDSCSKVVNS